MNGQELMEINGLGIDDAFIRCLGVIFFIGVHCYGWISANLYVIKINSPDEPIWGKEYCGSGEVTRTYGYVIYPTPDGGYIVAGLAYIQELTDFLVMKLDPNGNVIWAKRYGGSSYEYQPRLVKTSDGGYLLTGETWSFGSWPSEFLVINLIQMVI